MTNFFKNKAILITGVCGTVGRELLRQVVELEPSEIVGLDHNETELFFLTTEYQHNPKVHITLGDVRDVAKLRRKMHGIDIVLHAAALKHVLLCEESPNDAIQTNINGIQNLIHAALHCGVERVIYTSSDKAVNPTNVMGTSKLMGERLMTAANAHYREGSPIFSSVRFGNILASRGSVIPLFKRQIEQGQAVTLTDPNMTRFVMTLEEAVRLVLDAATMAKGGEVFVTKMPVIKIPHLAELLIEDYAPACGRDPKSVEVKVIGPRSGEKMYEELLSEEEIGRCIELDRYFVVEPAFRSLYKNIEYTYEGMKALTVENPYNSAMTIPMDKETLRGFLAGLGVFKDRRTWDKAQVQTSKPEQVPAVTN